MPQSDEKKQALLEALTASLGIVTTACRKANVARTSHYRWMENDPEYAEQVRDIQEQAIDFVESHLHQRIAEGNPACTIFYMKTKGKNRGYVERQEIEHTDNSLKVEVEIVKS